MKCYLPSSIGGRSSPEPASHECGMVAKAWAYCVPRTLASTRSDSWRYCPLAGVTLLIAVLCALDAYRLYGQVALILPAGVVFRGDFRAQFGDNRTAFLCIVRVAALPVVSTIVPTLTFAPTSPRRRTSLTKASRSRCRIYLWQGERGMVSAPLMNKFGPVKTILPSLDRRPGFSSETGLAFWAPRSTATWIECRRHVLPLAWLHIGSRDATYATVPRHARATLAKDLGPSGRPPS